MNAATITTTTTTTTTATATTNTTTTTTTITTTNTTTTTTIILRSFPTKYTWGGWWQGDGFFVLLHCSGIWQVWQGPKQIWQVDGTVGRLRLLPSWAG